MDDAAAHADEMVLGKAAVRQCAGINYDLIAVISLMASTAS